VATTAAIDRQRAKFRKLHESGCFVMPNAWDPGSARYLEHLGFPAVATTSGGFAFAHGLPDAQGALDLDTVLVHVERMVEAVAVPVNVDFENGYANDPQDVAANALRCIEAGASGVSIEDLAGDADRTLYELPLAVERIQATREAIDAHAAQVVLTARAEPFVAHVADPLNEALRRLAAYADAGADVVFTPGPRDLNAIRAIVEAVAPTPVNVLIGAPADFDVSDLTGAGVRRISVGSALARSAWGGFDRAARSLLDGSFAELEIAIPFAELNDLFSRRGPIA
jgi:2-methylisocitrate lyase-like PEP mutase family enzyme